MRVIFFFFSLAALVLAVAAWDKQDHEIFDLVGAIEAAEGKGTSFYSWLDVSPSASTADIAKAYRKKSMLLHPDKNGGLKNAHERFSRLGVVAKILRDPELRKRYDFFYKNGVPRWRGTGYYYSRFRPGLGTVAVFLIFLTSCLQYLVQKLNYRRDLERIEWIVQQARSAAWGAKMAPLEGQRKVKVNLGGPARLDEDGNAVGGRMIEMVVEGNDVFMIDSDGSLVAVDSSTAMTPSLKRTWFIGLVSQIWTKVDKRGGAEAGEEPLDRDNEKAESDDDTSPAGTDAGADGGRGTPPGANGGRPGAATMAGGRRRKAVRKR